MSAKAQKETPPAEEKFVPRVLLTFSQHVALEAERKGKESRVITIEPDGLCMRWENTAKFLDHFKPRDCDVCRAAFSFLRVNARAYLNNADAVGKILEVINMTSTGTTDLSTLTGPQLTEHYNKLAEGLGKSPVKGFKSKGEALKRIEALGGELKKPTPEQSKNKETARAAADKRLAGLEDLKASKAERKTAEKGKTKKSNQSGDDAGDQKEPAVATKKSTTKKSAPAKKADADKKPRGQGIGAFCNELILKGKSNEEVAEAAQKKFGSKTSASSVAWYRNKLRTEGKL